MIIEWLRNSNHWKHLVVGLGIHIFYLVSLLLFNCSEIGLIVIPFLSTALFMIAVDLKDKMWGGKFDWEDVFAGIIPSIVLSIITTILIIIL